MMASLYSAQRPHQCGFLVCLVLFVYLLAPNGSYAQTIRYVKPSSAGSADGSSWANATSDLQGAINSLTATGGQVWVANGLYKPTTTSGPDSRTISFAMKNRVAVYGGFAGSESTLSDRVVSYPSSTTLSGNIGDETTNSDNSHHVVVCLQTDSTAKLDGFVITAGNAIGVVNYYPNSIPYGVGLYSDRSNLRLNNCYFIANSTSGGGAVCMQNMLSSRLTNCAFQNNVGGGLYSECINLPPAELFLINCSFQSNSGGGVSLGSFGTLYPSRVTYSLTNCIFHTNTTLYGAAAIAVSDPGPKTNNNSVVVNLLNCIVFGNVGESSISVLGIPVLSARYSLFDQSVTNYNSDGTNLTSTYSPFGSTSSDQLISCSPAIDAGDPATTAARVGSIDLAGHPRFVRGRIDMGAYEYQETACNPDVGYVYSLQAGRWDNVATWSAGRLPTSADQVLLKHPVTIPQGYEARAQQLNYDLLGRLIYETGGRLLIP